MPIRRAMLALAGRVTSIDGATATVDLEDGTRREIAVPPLVQVAKGTRVTVLDSRDGARPVYLWSTSGS